MSYNRGYGRRRNRDDDYDDRRRDVYESPEEKIRSLIIKFGDADAEQELPQVANQLRERALQSIPAVAEGFRIGVTEEPYKIPYYAALLRSLHQPTEESASSGSIAKQILDDFWKGFQSFLDKLAWREIRLCLHFFTHLTVAQVISPSSMLALLQAFTAVLEEFGVSHGRGKHAALCASEALMRAGRILKQYSAPEVTTLINIIQNYADSASSNKPLVAPIVLLHSPNKSVEGADELLDTVLIVLKALDAVNFEEPTSAYLEPYLNLPPLDTTVSPYYDLPSVLVPPEAIELENITGEGGEAGAQTQKKEEWPEYVIRLFDNDVTADHTSPAGYPVRTLISDIVDIFEVNRKECARLLLDLAKWTPPGTFKPRPGAPVQNGEETGKLWQLESCIIETILSKLCRLPDTVHKPMYYISLITELCKGSPQTVGPAVGKSIRKLYGLLADGFDVEVARRFTEWFATHMSNFGFQWVWKEWIPDLSLTSHHPKRNFIRRAIETEIRLSYHDRILKTLPEPFLAPEADALPEQAPGPEFDYDDPLRPHHDAAQSLLNLLRGRSKADDVIAHIETLKNNLVESSDGDVNVDQVIRSITMQSLLHIGSRSFSHFLNAIERYLPVLRSIATSADAKADILMSAVEFWRRNRQMVGIVFDKLMQYQIVDPSDVVAWAFTARGDARAGTIDAFAWDLVKGALDKANGRVLIAKKKVALLRKEEDDDRARAKAHQNMEVDGDTAPENQPSIDSPALTTALKANATLTREQKAVLSRTLNEFVNALSDSSSILSEKSWHNRVNWEDADWDLWETWGWYRNFCRVYAPYLDSYSTALSTVAFSKIEGSRDVAHVLLRNIWNISLGQEP
ncbi:hypothetical protein BD410DRAFT_735868 [Rickenella mellea]|uniref:Cap binding protein 80-PB n=1 Tax=Rickenella mellea TaxID=50990 RepID=A0A4R5XFN9_9AGAM|nr:hypothetical protein BD410DRAFT_735868 [Rickenella mellea]